MSQFSVDIIQIRDSSFTIGLKLGKYLKNNPLLHVFESGTRPEIDYTSLKSIFLMYSPHLLEEIEGLACGLDMSTKKAASLFSGYDMPKIEALGCSALITKDYYTRNYDFTPNLYDGMFSVIQPKKAFATAGYNLQILGRHDGVNQEGFVSGLHFVSNHSFAKGLAPWTAVRMILDTCASVDEAIQMLKEIPHSACYNFSLGDKHGSIAVVESSPTTVIVRSGDESLSCVNHFQNKNISHKNRPSIDGSIKRDAYIRAIGKENYTQQEMFDTFRDKRSPLFFTDYNNLFGTLHTFSYSFEDSRVMTTIAQSETILDFNIQDWTNGENINKQKLIGEIEGD